MRRKLFFVSFIFFLFQQTSMYATDLNLGIIASDRVINITPNNITTGVSPLVYIFTITVKTSVYISTSATSAAKVVTSVWGFQRVSPTTGQYPTGGERSASMLLDPGTYIVPCFQQTNPSGAATDFHAYFSFTPQSLLPLPNPEFIFNPETSYYYNHTEGKGYNYILSSYPTIGKYTPTFNPDSAIVEIKYFDGLGRLTQRIKRGFSPDHRSLISLTGYDYYGRKGREWLPAAISSQSYMPPSSAISAIYSYYGVDTTAYQISMYETSHLSRVKEQHGPGKEWRSARKYTKQDFLINNNADSLSCSKYLVNATGSSMSLQKNGSYPAGDLYVTRYEDEDSNISFEFSNKQGQIILERRLLQASSKMFLDTYYVYDDFGKLCYVLPPLASSNLTIDASYNELDNVVLQQYAYIYKYNKKHKCFYKKLPGVDAIIYIYDISDDIVFSQDGNQRIIGQWTFFLYDKFRRLTVQGVCSNTNTDSASSVLITCVCDDADSGLGGSGYTSSFALSSPIVHIVNYYDNYNFLSLVGFNNTNFPQATINAKGFLTGSVTTVLPDGTKLYSANFYDIKGRVIKTIHGNHLGGYETTNTSYTFTNKPSIVEHIHTASGKSSQTEVYTYAYDRADRLTNIKYKLNSGGEIVLISNIYDELGRLKTSTHNGQANLATTYTYNIRSWLISSSSPLFNQTLYYNDTYAGSTARYNGNISAMSWKMSDESPTRGYKFSYDNLSRLTAANYLENGSANDHFNTAYAYDKQGNMTSLARKGNTGTATYGDIDVLTMTYAGNQLVKAEDTGSSVSLSASMDFKNNSNAVKEYSYDANGNLIQDLNKGINGITYNLLNLPQTLTISNPLGSATNSYTYAADGRKLKTMIGGKTTDYCGNVIYENGVLKRILVEGGYIEGGAYYFYLTDHLGNNRVVANASGTVVQTNHYYPFGMSFAEGMQDSSQPYKYNGKELDTDRGLNMYDYSARYMDPALGRFNTVDPLAEKYYSISPYAYCAGNPVRFFDPNGKNVVATTIDAQRMILNTLPKDMQQHIQFDKNGYINQDAIKDIQSESQNFNSLKTMVLSDRTLEVELDDKFTYSDKSGNINEQAMSYLGIDPDFIGNDNGKGIGTSTGETGLLGKTLFPDKNGLQNSTDNNIKVIINSNLSEEGRAQTYSHEANGHAYVYIKTNGDRQRASHQYTAGNVDLNRTLFELINKSINETILNMK